MRGTDDCWTDHRLIRSKLSIQIAPKHRHQRIIREINVKRLADEERSREFRVLLYIQKHLIKKYLSCTLRNINT